MTEQHPEQTAPASTPAAAAPAASLPSAAELGAMTGEGGGTALAAAIALDTFNDGDTPANSTLPELEAAAAATAGSRDPALPLVLPPSSIDLALVELHRRYRAYEAELDGQARVEQEAASKLAAATHAAGATRRLLDQLSSVLLLLDPTHGREPGWNEREQTLVGGSMTGTGEPATFARPAGVAADAVIVPNQ